MYQKIHATLAGAALICVCSAVTAQPVYRIVGPDGRVTFSDRAPSADLPSESVSAASVGGGSGAAGTNLNGLPLEVKQAATKYPFTLYTAKDCGACDSARSYLKNRGIPFTEKTITSNEEIKALTKLNADGTIPFATLGGQHLKGFNENDWESYLNAAGYPAKSQLPSSYRQADAQPLIPKRVPPANAAAPAEPNSSTTNNTSVVPQRVTPENPAGITF